MARPKLEISDEETAAIRARITEWMAAKGLDTAMLAARLGVAVETVRWNLAQGEAYQGRGLAGPFLEKFQRVTGLTLRLASVAPASPAVADAWAPGLTEYLVGFLGRVTLATGNQLARLLRMDINAFNAYAAKLKATGLLAACAEPMVSGQPGPRHLWALGPAGYKQAVKMLGRSPARPIVAGKLRSDVFVRHTLLVADIAIAILLGLGDGLIYWEADAGCRCRLAHVPDRSYAEPDVFFTYALADGIVHACWVEAETGSQAEAAVAEKAIFADDYQRYALVADHGTERLRLLWVAERAAHVDWLVRRTGPLRPRTQNWYSAIDDIRSHGIAAPVWLTLCTGDRKLGLLDT